MQTICYQTHIFRTGHLELDQRKKKGSMRMGKKCAPRTQNAYKIQCLKNITGQGTGHGTEDPPVTGASGQTRLAS
jgi:hypothetical protein